MMPELSTKTKLLNAFRAMLRVRPIEALMARAVRGREPASVLGRLTPNHYQYRLGSRRRVIRMGSAFDLDISDMVDWWVYFGFDDPVLRTVEQYVRPGDICVDCGANVGYVSLLMARLVGESGRVLSFEPHPMNASRFRQNMALNAVPQIELFEFALGEDQGTAFMKEEPSNQGMNRIDPTGSQGGVEVEVRSLDQVLSERGLERLRLLKIDVEGFEQHVLAGASATLRQFRPILIVEVDTALMEAQGGHPRELLELLLSLGYECRVVVGQEPLTLSTDWSGAHVDILAIPSGRER